MVPTAIVKQARAVGLDMIAICDHNSTENVAAVAKAGRRESLSVIPGIEITSREEVHVLGLFAAEDTLTQIQTLVYDNLPGENDEAVFGPQTVVDYWNQPTATNTKLLIGATNLTLDQIVKSIHHFGGLAIAAHVDRQSFGLIGHLGFVPDGLELDALEVSPRAAEKKVGEFPVVTSSDGHRLQDIGRSFTSFVVEDGTLEEIGKALDREDGRGVLLTMEDLSLHILDVVENAITASADRVTINIVEDTRSDLLYLEIRDNGRGMDEDLRKKALDPFFTTRTTRRVGLGLPLLAQSAREGGGTFELASEPGHGTTVRASFQLSHPDRKPLGDIPETLRTVMCGRPDLHLQFQYVRNSEVIAELRSSRLHAQESTNG
jgi:predicted metal-dependent phosphoesterase TrpH